MMNFRGVVPEKANYGQVSFDIAACRCLLWLVVLVLVDDDGHGRGCGGKEWKGWP